MSDQQTETWRSRRPQLDDADWLREQYVVLGRTMYEIGAELGCHNTTVRSALQRHGIAARPGGRGHPAQLDDVDWLREQYVALGRVAGDIGAEVDRTSSAVLRALRRHGIPVRPGGSPRVVKLDDVAWLREQYVALGRTTDDIGDELGCSGNSVVRALHRHGIPVRPGGSPSAFARLDDAVWLREQYVALVRSANDIAEELGCSGSLVRQALQRHGIGSRPGGHLRPWRLDDVAWLGEQYVTLVRSTDDIGAELGCSCTAVNDALRRHGIAVRPSGGGRFPHLYDAAWLSEQYVALGRSLQDIATELGCHAQTVCSALQRHGIVARPALRPFIFTRLNDVAWLRAQYVGRGRASTDIAAELGCTSRAVLDALRRHGILIRGRGPRTRDPMRPTALYVLVCPDGRPVYVGQSVTIDTRIARHWRRREDWRALWADLPAPPTTAWAVITTVPALIADVEEARLIAALIEHGESLTNVDRRPPRWDEA